MTTEVLQSLELSASMVIQISGLALVILFPVIATWLPGHFFAGN